MLLKKSANGRDSLIRLFGAALLTLMAIKLFLILSPERTDKLTKLLILPLTAAMVTALLTRLGLPRMAEGRLLAVFALWYPLTRVFNGDYYLTANLGNVYDVVMACCVFYPCAFLLGRRKFGGLLRAASLFYGVAMGLLAWLAVLGVLCGWKLVAPLDGGPIRMDLQFDSVYRLNVLNTHPNITGCYFYVAIALLIYLFAATRRILPRILYALLGVGLYLGVAYTMSNSATVVLSLIAGLSVYAAVTARGRASGRRIAAGVLAALTAAALTAGGLSLTVKLSAPAIERAAVLAETQVARDTQGSDAETPSAANEAEPQAAPAEVTSRMGLTTLYTRFRVYEATIPMLADRPETLLIGNLNPDVMQYARQTLHLPETHMHNAFLQVLMETGLLGFAAAIAFCVLLVIRMARLYFSPKASLALRLMVLVPAALMCHSMVEPFVFLESRLYNPLFFLLSGAVVLFSMHVSPWRKADAVPPG